MARQSHYEHAVVLAGHMLDGPEPRPLRFPPELEPSARQAIARALDGLPEGTLEPVLALSSAARGGDIFFLEACVERRLPYIICLAISPDGFRHLSVEGTGGGWGERFARLWAAAPAEARLFMPARIRPLSGGPGLYEAHKLRMLYRPLTWGEWCMWPHHRHRRPVQGSS